MILLLLCYWLMKWYEKHRTTEITLYIISATTLDETHSTAHFSWLLRLQTTNYKVILLKTETKYKQQKKNKDERWKLICQDIISLAHMLLESWQNFRQAGQQQQKNRTLIFNSVYQGYKKNVTMAWQIPNRRLVRSNRWYGGERLDETWQPCHTHVLLS